MSEHIITTPAVHRLWIPGWLPTPLNRLMRTHWAKRNRVVRAEYYTIVLHARTQSIAPATGPRILRVELRLEAKDRERDGDACVKALRDGLVRAKLLVDDKPYYCRSAGDPVQVRVGPGEGGTLIELEDAG
jgi:hypothetical protein